MDKSKPFGLIISKRSQSYRPSVSTVFGGSDSDDEPTKKKKMPSIPQAKPKRAALPEMSEDPSIYEYDSIYDDMKAQEVAKVAPKDINKPSRYIGSLLKAADKRKKDQERRVEKKVHHEREQEGDKFKDKEAFVTTAYKKKMQEMEEEEERERRENMLNEMMDVTKQKDLSGFYRHFLKQSVGEEKVPVFGERYIVKESEVVVKQEKDSDEEGASRKTDKGVGLASTSKDAAMQKTFKKEKEGSPLPDDVDQDTDMDSSSDEDTTGGKALRRSKDTVDNSSKKDLLTDKEKSSFDDNIDRDTDIDSSSDEDTPDDRVVQQPKDTAVKIGHTEKSSLIPDQADKDSDISSNEDDKVEDIARSSSSKALIGKQSSGKEDFPRKRKRLENSGKLPRNIRKRAEDVDSSCSDEAPSASDDETEEGPKENGGSEEGLSITVAIEKGEAQPQKPKVDIYAKRTTGDVFADAQARYFQRMAARSA